MYESLRSLHLIAVLPCIPLGVYLIYFSKKGASRHRLLGKVYMSLMFFQASISLFMQARVGPQFLGHFGYIHLLSLVTLFTVPYSLVKVRAHKLDAHRNSMIILFWSGLFIAGAFTLVPGRYLHEVLFS